MWEHHDLCMYVQDSGENRQLVTDELVDAPITPNFPFGSRREIVGDYVNK